MALLVLPRLSVIICSLNGANGVECCLRALDSQTLRPALEVILVDDGSTDATASIGQAYSATVVRHSQNLGLAAARNSGVRIATASVVAFLDDDCEPGPEWAEHLLAGYQEEEEAAAVTGVGGPVVPQAPDGFMCSYLMRNNPIKPQELELAKSNSIPYRFGLYLKRQWTRQEPSGRRDVYALAGANMSFRRQALIAVGGFDERFRFGAEDLDICLQMRQVLPSCRLVWLPNAPVIHHFVPSLHDALRRSRAYGSGLAGMYRKWPSLPPVLFPGPLAVLMALLISVRFPALLVAALVIPHLFHPRGACDLAARRSWGSVLDAYIQVAQEASGNVGFLAGFWRFRRLVPEASVSVAYAPSSNRVQSPGSHEGVDVAP